LEADDLAGGEPVYEEAGSLGGLVGGGLNVAQEEGEHEEGGWEDEEEFDGGDGAFDKHSRDFVMQSRLWSQVKFLGSQQSTVEGRKCAGTQEKADSSRKKRAMARSTSLRKPTRSHEANAKKRRRLAPLGMTGWLSCFDPTKDNEGAKMDLPQSAQSSRRQIEYRMLALSNCGIGRSLAGT
jgi:hypothetical protein